MDVKELRIGNWTRTDILGNTLVKFGSWLETELIQTAAPIPLTEEWLEKFGFFNKYKSVHCQWWKCYGEGPPYRIFELPQKSNVDDDNNFIPQEQVWYYDARIDVIYVHQLQNLYFALTGEELTIQ